MAAYMAILRESKVLDKEISYLLIFLCWLWVVLSLILAKGTTCNFKFHWRAQPCQITHLCFADDLLIFCHGDLNSVMIINDCLQRFSQLSGLMPNQDKSQFFIANVSSFVRDDILNCLRFQEGSLITFLGVPLISSKPMV